LIPQLCCSVPRAIDQRLFDDVIMYDVDDRVEKDVAVCNQYRQISLDILSHTTRFHVRTLTAKTSPISSLSLILIIIFAIIWKCPGNEPYLFDNRRIGSSINEPSIYIAMVCQLH